MPNRLYELHRKGRVRRLVATYVPREVEHRFGKSVLRIRLEDALAEGWYDRDWEEPIEVSGAVSAGLGAGDVMFDIGAHQCVVAMMLADHVAPDGQVIAVEAEPHNARVGATNVGLNARDSVTVVHAAIASQSGRIRFTEGLNGHVANPRAWGTVDVPAVTLDELAEKYGVPDFVMLDVEGYELAALRGATATLSKHRPKFVIELHVGCGLEQAGGSTEQVLDCLAGSNYEVSVASEKTGGEFLALAGASDALESRCYLLATPLAVMGSTSS